jgi:hypothetical protein
MEKFEDTITSILTQIKKDLNLTNDIEITYGYGTDRIEISLNKTYSTDLRDYFVDNKIFKSLKKNIPNLIGVYYIIKDNIITLYLIHGNIKINPIGLPYEIYDNIFSYIDELKLGRILRIRIADPFG